MTALNFPSISHASGASAGVSRASPSVVQENNLSKTTAKIIVFWDSTRIKRKNEDLNHFRDIECAQPVSSIGEAASFLDKSQEKYHLITIAGHGSDSSQGIGSGRKEEYVKGRGIHHQHLDDIYPFHFKHPPFGWAKGRCLKWNGYR